MEKINVELLIPLIEERPVIWDKTLDVYKNKVLRETAWREICLRLKDDLEEINKTQRHEFGRAVLKKWTQIRDSWCKDNKKMKDKKPYKYYDQLSFLKKIIDKKDAQKSGDAKDFSRGETNEGEGTTNEERDSDNEDETENASRSETENSEEEETINEESRRIENKGNNNKNALKRKQYEAANKMIKFLENINTQKEDDSHLHFFKSLLPITTTLDADETLQFQAGVITLLQNIKRQRRNKYENTGSEIFVSPENPLDNLDIKTNFRA